MTEIRDQIKRQVFDFIDSDEGTRFIVGAAVNHVLFNESEETRSGAFRTSFDSTTNGTKAKRKYTKRAKRKYTRKTSTTPEND